MISHVARLLCLQVGSLWLGGGQRSRPLIRDLTKARGWPSTANGCSRRGSIDPEFSRHLPHFGLVEINQESR